MFKKDGGDSTLFVPLRENRHSFFFGACLLQKKYKNLKDVFQNTIWNYEISRHDAIGNGIKHGDIKVWRQKNSVSACA